MLRMLWSACARFNSAVSSAIRPRESALRQSGRLSVSSTAPSRVSISRWSAIHQPASQSESKMFTAEDAEDRGARKTALASFSRLSFAPAAVKFPELLSEPLVPVLAKLQIGRAHV